MSDNNPTETTGELLAKIKYIVAEKQTESFRTEVYNKAKVGMLTVSDILLLRLLRNEENIR
jgi:hypothetical protein